MTSTFVATDLGRLHVSATGTGPSVVLWHSLFFDSTSWGPIIESLARHRTVLAIDGPSHGASEAATRDFSVPECAAIAAQALDQLGLTDPVDWVGNAWGGHVGIQLAMGARPRVATLTTIGTPVRGFSTWEKLVKGFPVLVWLYRAVGPVGVVTKPVSDSLLGAEAVAAQPDRCAAIVDSFRRADRTGMARAIRSLLLRRTDITELLPDVSVPTLVLSARDDAIAWRPDEAERTCAAIPDCRVHAVAGGGHVAPLVLDPDRIVTLIEEFWRTAANPCRPSRA